MANLNHKSVLKLLYNQRARIDELIKDNLFAKDAQGLLNELPKRQIVADIQTYIDDFLNDYNNLRWSILLGLRGSGKTTVLLQLAHYLKHIDPQQADCNYIYLSLDEVCHRWQTDLNHCLEVYEEILHHEKRIDYPTLLFLDEVQSDSQWAQILKVIHDKYKNFFIVCTGSSVIKLQLSADIAGRRAMVDKIYPLDFREYVHLKDSSIILPDDRNLDEIIHHSSSAEEVYDQLKTMESNIKHWWSQVDHGQLLKNYIQGQNLPFLLREEITSTRYIAMIESNLNRVLNEDMLSLGYNWTLSTLNKIEFLLYYLAITSEALSLADLGRKIHLNTASLNNILEALTQSEILIKIPAWGKSSMTGRPVKYHFMSTAFRLKCSKIRFQKLHTMQSFRGILLEDLVALYYYQNYADNLKQGELNYYIDNKNSSSDFILKLAPEENQLNTRIAIEIGLGQKDISQVQFTLNKVDCKYGLIFANTSLKLHKEYNIVSIPLDYFFLM